MISNTVKLVAAAVVAVGAYVFFTKKDTGASTGACSRCGKRPMVNPVTVGRSPYNLHHADASRFKALGELLLLEDHMINDPCPDCMNKHAITASRFMSEAAGLAGGEDEDVKTTESIESIRAELKPETDIALAAKTRDVRKSLQARLNLSHAHGAETHDGHGHG